MVAKSQLGGEMRNIDLAVLFALSFVAAPDLSAQRLPQSTLKKRLPQSTLIPPGSKRTQEVANKPVSKACHCSPDCTCGCNAGGVCSCGRPTLTPDPVRAVIWWDAYEQIGGRRQMGPVSVPQPAFLSNPFPGPRFSGSCGPGG